MDRAAGCRLRQELMLRLVSVGQHCAIPSRSCKATYRSPVQSMSSKWCSRCHVDKCHKRLPVRHYIRCVTSSIGWKECKCPEYCETMDEAV